MSPEMTNIVGGIIIAIVSTVLTILVTVLLNKRKVLEYNVFSMPLLRFMPKKERMLNVSVDKSLLTGAEEDKGQEVAVTNAYGFEVEVRNIGNDDVTNASITLQLHESAKIIECETNPPSQTGFEVSIESDKGSLNTRRVIVPYINRRERFFVRVISTENDNRDCQVNIRGLGVRARRYNEMRFGLRLMTTLIVIFLPFIFIQLAFPNLFTSLGTVTTVETVTKENTRYPLWLLICVIIYVTIPLLFFFISEIRNQPRRINEYGSGGIVKVQEWDDDKRK